MTPISEILSPEHVNLALAAKDKAAAVEEVLAKLNGDSKVTNWLELRDAVISRDAPALEENKIGICIAHGRTEAVRSLVMAVGRSTDGIVCPEIKSPLRFVFVAGIPAAFDSEYLRVIGAIVRLCRDRHQVERLLAAREARHFISLLGAGEVKL